MTTNRASRLLVLLFTGLIALPAQATATLKLRKSFIEANKDRATLTASFMVDKAHDDPKPAKEDGDIHIAGWSDDLKLVAVAEIMNAKKELEAVARANAVEGRTQAVGVTPVWRIWPEHGCDRETGTLPGSQGLLIAPSRRRS